MNVKVILVGTMVVVLMVLMDTFANALQVYQI